MATHMDRCSRHQKPATGRCFSCHKPTCPECHPRDGTCSEACFRSKQSFGAGRAEKVARPWALPSLTMVLLVAGGVWAAGRYLLQLW